MLVVPPLFDEANRMRRTLALTMRLLAERGIGSVLPDLPGQNDDPLPTEQATLALWRDALGDIAANLPRPFVVASWRGGALVDDAASGAAGWWRMAPQNGASILRAMVRTRIAGEREAGRSVTAAQLLVTDSMLELGGNHLSKDMRNQLEASVPGDISPMRLVTIGAGGLAGSALWLRAEPGEDRPMAQAMADDIADWCDTLTPHPRQPGSLPAEPRGRRRQVEFRVHRHRCAATLDDAPGAHGLLIVSGGNEIRSGAHRGMAALAGHIAARGHPVLRFDRRGVGDSEGDNAGFDGNGDDIAAALAAFRRECPHITQVTAFGNCDAASALLLHHREQGPDALLLANPWTIDASDTGSDTPGAALPAAAIRARYAAKLRNPRELLRLLRGGVDMRKLWRGLSAARRPSSSSSLAARLAAAMDAVAAPMTLLIARGDGTAQTFMAQWSRPAFAGARKRAIVHAHDTASHGFADDAARIWLWERIEEALTRSGQGVSPNIHATPSSACSRVES